MDNVDLWVGIIGEKRNNGDMGMLGGRLVALQFKNIRNSNKNWY